MHDTKCVSYACTVAGCVLKRCEPHKTPQDTSARALQVMDCLEGANGRSLPWEGGNLSPGNRTRLGGLRTVVMQLLSRDADERPSMAQFCDSCARVLAGTTTVEG